MGDKTIKAIIFVAGAAIGSAATWGIVKKKYEKLADEEIASVKERFAKRNEEEQEPEEVEEEKPSYNDMIRQNGYSEPEEPEEEMPEIIEPDEYGEMFGYDEVGLTRYADGVMVYDISGEIMEDVEHMIGLDNLKQMGKYEEDMLHIRNDALKCDYEISQDERKYYGEIVPEE